MSSTIPPPPPRSLLLSVALAWCGIVVCFLLLQASAGGRWLLCSRQIDCRAVLSSKYAVAGGVPLPWLGAAFYAGLLLLLLLALAVRSPVWRQNILKLALWITVVGGSFTAGLIYVQFAVLHAFCGLCMTSAGIVITLMVSVVRASRKRTVEYGDLPGVSVAFGIFALTGFAGFYFLLPAPDEEVVLEVGSRKFLRRQMEQDLRKRVQPLRANVRAIELAWVKEKTETTLLALEGARRGLAADQVLSPSAADSDGGRKLVAELAQTYGVHSYLSARITGPQAFDLSNAQTLGPANAPVELVVFSDYTCKHCIEFDKVLRMIRNEFPQILIAYRDFPLAENSFTAAVAGRCAAEQGAFWAYHDRLFDENGDVAEPKLLAIAASMGLDGERFEKCLHSKDVRKIVTASAEDAARDGISATPAVFLNGVMVGGMIGYADLKGKILEELQATRR